MGAQVKQHNSLLLQLASSFPAGHPGSTVNTYDFGAAFDKACTHFSSACAPCLSRKVQWEGLALFGCPMPEALPARFGQQNADL